MASVQPITRVTLFKIPDQADQEKLLNIYKEMPNKAKKVAIIVNWFSKTRDQLITNSDSNTERETLHPLSHRWTSIRGPAKSGVYSRSNLRL